ncbi:MULTISPECIES: cation:proton antiporter [unclassified Methanobrevibacter]|mgnify:FL=1|jgi:Kef-type K+ transport system membrane component KefB|uniref:cation:proton antiporter n=1 Tax=unclassified Methanobrevibacter TaxID=2638681 RepID=UPI0039B9AF44
MADIFPLILGILILLASLISIRAGISVTVIEILLGVIVGNLGFFHAESWMLYLASFGGILLTFLAGVEIDVNMLKENFKESFTIGFLSFLIPFAVIFVLTYNIIGWGLNPSLLTATALSETSIAVVYSVLAEKGLFSEKIGKLIMVATFITDMCTAVALSVLFVKFDIYTVIFYVVSIVVLVLSYYLSDYIFNNVKLKNKLAEIEIKYIFLLLLIFIFFASLGGGQAILPSFVLGVILSRYFKENRGDLNVKSRFKTVAFAILTPIFFIMGGMKVSIPLILSSFGIFIVMFALRQLSKYVGVYYVSRYFLKSNYTYVTLMMSTGLTFGLVAALFGLNSGLINQTTYSVLTGVLVLSAVLPTFMAEKWYPPIHSEDIVESEM